MKILCAECFTRGKTCGYSYSQESSCFFLSFLYFFFFFPIPSSMQFARLELQLKPIIWKEIGKMAWHFQVLLQHVKKNIQLFFFLINLYLFWMSLIERKGEQHMYGNSFWDRMHWFHTAKLQHCLFWARFFYWHSLMY